MKLARVKKKKKKGDVQCIYVEPDEGRHGLVDT
jgi:hypothetical protein